MTSYDKMNELQYLIYDDTKGGHHPQYPTENSCEYSYSSSEYSNISNSPMEFTSIKMDETSSTCSSNNNDNMLDSVRLPKPPPNPRKQRRQLTSTSKASSEIFEFSDDFIPETTSAIKGQNSPPSISNSHIHETMDTISTLSENQDRYHALRNLFTNDNNPFSNLKQQKADVTNNWILGTYSAPWYEENATNSVKSDISPFNNDFPRNDKAQLVTTRARFDEMEDKYAAISQEDLKDKVRNWSRSVMGVGQGGWSDRLLSGNCQHE